MKSVMRVPPPPPPSEGEHSKKFYLYLFHLRSNSKVQSLETSNYHINTSPCCQGITDSELLAYLVQI